MTFERTLRQIIIGGLFFILLTPLIVSRPLFFPFISGKAFFFRIVVEIIFALWLLLAWRVPAYRPRRSPISWAMLALALATVFATIFSQNVYHSFWSNFERMEGLLGYLHLFAYFLVISSVFHSERIWHWFFNTSLGVSLVLIGYSLAQMAGALSISQGKLDATFGNSTYLATYMLLHAFLAAFLMFKHWRLVWTRYVYGALIVLQLFVMYQTTTRGTLLGLLAGVGLAALILAIKKWREPKIRRTAVGLLIALVVLVGGFLALRNTSFVLQSPVLSRFAGISLTDTTTESRLTIWGMSWRAFQEHPLLGWGPENYGLIFNKYYQPKLFPDEQWFDRSHDIFFDWLTTTGSLGLLAYLALYAAALYQLWRRKENDVSKSIFTGLLAAYVVGNIFVFDNLTSYLIFFALLAYWHYHYLTIEPEPTGHQSSRELTGLDGLVVGLVIIALGASLYFFNIKPLQANAKLIQAIGQSPAGADATLVAKTRLASFQQVFAAGTFASREAVEQLVGLTVNVVGDTNVTNEVKQSFAQFALTETKKQVDLFPGDARMHLIAGALYQQLGQKPEALTELTRALELSPQKQTIMFQLAGAYMENGDKPKGLDLAKRAFELDERFSEARKFYGLILIYSGQVVEADKILSAEPNLDLDDRFINAYVSVKRYDLVLKLWQNKVKANPNDVQTRFNLAAAYLSVGQRDAAIKELQTASTLNPAVKAQADTLIQQIRSGQNPLQNPPAN